MISYFSLRDYFHLMIKLFNFYTSSKSIYLLSVAIEAIEGIYSFLSMSVKLFSLFTVQGNVASIF